MSGCIEACYCKWRAGDIPVCRYDAEMSISWSTNSSRRSRCSGQFNVMFLLLVNRIIWIIVISDSVYYIWCFAYLLLMKGDIAACAVLCAKLKQTRKPTAVQRTQVATIWLIPHVGKVPFWKVATDAFNLKANYAGLVSWPGTAPGFDNLRMKLNKISFSRIPDAKKLPEHSKIIRQYMQSADTDSTTHFILVVISDK